MERWPREKERERTVISDTVGSESDQIVFGYLSELNQSVNSIIESLYELMRERGPLGHY